MSETAFPLKGYSIPLTPKGRSSLVEPPPWHFGGELLHIVFEADPRRINALIPPPLEPGPTPGVGAVWLVEWVSVSESNPELAFTHPERTVYRECVILLSASFKGEPGYIVPYIWVDNDFTLVRGFIQGFPKKLGQIHLTKLHALNPKVGGRRPGACMKGICSAHGEKLVEGTVRFTREGAPSEIPFGRIYLMRHFPDMENPAKPSVHEILFSNITAFHLDNIWTGDADLSFFHSEIEELAEIGPVKATRGFYYDIGLTIDGGKVVYHLNFA